MKFLRVLLVSTLTLSANAIASTPSRAQLYGPPSDSMGPYLHPSQYYESPGIQSYPASTVRINFTGTSSSSSCAVRIGLKNATTGQEYWQGVYTATPQFYYFFLSIPAGKYRLFAANPCPTYRGVSVLSDTQQ